MHASWQQTERVLPPGSWLLQQDVCMLVLLLHLLLLLLLQQQDVCMLVLLLQQDVCMLVLLQALLAGILTSRTWGCCCRWAALPCS
jgi:hypothetical protein